MTFLRKTLDDCVGPKALAYLGVLHDGPEALETLTFHSELLTCHLAALIDLDTYHQSFPWRVCMALEAASLPRLLSSMKACWKFTTECLDRIGDGDKLYHEMAHTRFQPFRDLMVKAEYLVFVQTNFVLNSQFFAKETPFTQALWL